MSFEVNAENVQAVSDALRKYLNGLKEESFTCFECDRLVIGEEPY